MRKRGVILGFCVCLRLSGFLSGLHAFICIEAQKPTQNPEIPKKKTPCSRELFRKVRANFCLLPCDASQETNRNCSEKLVQMNFFILGGFFRVENFSTIEFSLSKIYCRGVSHEK